MNLPIDFENMLKKELGDEDYLFFEESLSFPTPTSLRINNHKIISNQNYTDSVPWCSTGYYLGERPSFTSDPLFHMGAYYVQEASSMFLEQGIKQFITDDVIGLDLCAAPGGKSTLTKSLLSPSSLLVCNEYVRSRSFILSENMTKWGDPNYIVCNNKPADFSRFHHFFDFIVIDAPCSGEGMFRKDEKAIDEWSLINVMNCQSRQEDIIKDIWDALKPGGFIFYSTCTYNTYENEAMVSFIQNMGSELKTLEIDEKWNITTKKIGDGEVYHFYPHRIKGEGFFFSVLQKEQRSLTFKSSDQKKNKVSKTKETEVLKYLYNPENYELILKDTNVLAIPNTIYSAYQQLSSSLNIISGGINIGQFKGKDFIPHQSLALSNVVNNDQFIILQVNRDIALSYLKCEPLYFIDVPKGFILLQYQGLNLGFVKNIGSRANNLYPSEWRIRNKNII